jgi:hypothetical protein
VWLPVLPIPSSIRSLARARSQCRPARSRASLLPGSAANPPVIRSASRSLVGTLARARSQCRPARRRASVAPGSAANPPGTSAASRRRGGTACASPSLPPNRPPFPTGSAFFGLRRQPARKNATPFGRAGFGTPPNGVRLLGYVLLGWDPVWRPVPPVATLLWGFICVLAGLGAGGLLIPAPLGGAGSCACPFGAASAACPFGAGAAGVGAVLGAVGAGCRFRSDKKGEPAANSARPPNVG